MDAESQIEEILGEWRAQRDRGEAPDPERVVAAHPELGEELRARFAALELLEGMLRQARLEGGTPPERIGDYRVLREVGRGGMGVVYEAEQEAMRRRVALKVLYPRITGSEKAAKRFQREARAAGRLHHTNIVPVYELGREGELWFYSMELVEGIALGELIRGMRQLAAPGAEGSADSDEEATPTPSSSSSLGTTPGTMEHYQHVARLISGVAEALEAAHKDGVIHRDLKPSNLILDQEGVLKVIDFGLARVRDEEASMTGSGDRLGTPGYMSPEQARKKKVDHRSDVYSLGATLYELLTLRAPFPGDAATVIAQIPVRYPRAPRRIEAKIPRDLETIVQKAMEKEPGKRYASASRMAQDLRAFAEGDAVRARPIGPLGRSWRRVKRHRALSGLVTLVLVLVIGGGIFAWVAYREGQQRIALEYRMLCAKAEGALARTGEQRSVLYLDLLEEDTALEVFNRAIALLPERPEAWLGRALALGRTPEERLDDIAAAERWGLPARTVHLARAHVMDRSGRREEARREQGLAARYAMGGGADAFFEGRLLLAAKRRQEGIALLSLAIRESQDGSFHRFLALFHRGVAREDLGDLEGALEDFSALRAAGDEGLGLRLRIASLWRRLGREEKAEQAFQQLLATTARQDDERAWLLLCGSCREQAPDWTETTARTALRSHPDAVPILMELALALRDLGRDDEHVAICRRILELDPRHALAWGSWGMALCRLKNYEDALRKTETLLEIEPDNARGHNNRGMILGRLGRDEEALAALLRAVELDPSSTVALANIASRYAERGLYEEASAVVERVLELDPEYASAFSTRGQSLLGVGAVPEALAALQRALHFDPDHETALAWQGEALLRLDRSEDALSSFERALAIDEDRFFFWTGKAGACLALGRTDEALSAIERALDLNPEHAWSHGRRAEILHRLGRHREALAAVDRSLSIWHSDPTPPPQDQDLHAAHEVRGNLLLALQRFAEAVEAYTEALETQSECVPVIYGRAVALLRLGRYAESAAAYKRCLELDPDRPLRDRQTYTRLLELSIARFHQGRYADALSITEPFLELPTDSGDLLMTRARYLAWLGRWEEATPLMTRAWELGLKSPGARVFCVEILLLQGDPRRALRLTERLVSRDELKYGRLHAACLRALGDDDDAQELAGQLSEDEVPAEERLHHAWLCAVAGDTLRAHALLESWDRPWYPFETHLRARVHAVLGEEEEALHWLERAIDQGYRRPESAAPELDFASLADDARFERLRARQVKP